MNWNIPLLSTVVLAAVAALLSSCDSLSSGGSGGQTIHNPTVEEMARLEAQWGLPPRTVKPRYREAGPGDLSTQPTVPVEGQPQPSQPAAPAQETVLPAQPPIPPAPQSIPPSLR